MKLKKLILGLFFLASFTAFSQNGELELTVEKIMQEPDLWIGSLPDNISWSEDSKTVYFYWNPEKESGESLYQISLTNSNPVKTTLAQQKSIPPRRAYYSKDGNRKVFVKSGNVYVYNIAKKELQQITSGIGNIRSANFTSDEKEIVFELDNNLYTWSFENGAIKKITNIKEKKRSSGDKKSDEDQWYKDQQNELFQVFEDKKRENDFRSKQRSALKEDGLKPVFITGSSIYDLKLSPNKRYVTFLMRQSQGKGKKTQIMNYVTKSGYAEPKNARDKVGKPEDFTELYIIDLKRDSSYKAQVDSILGLNEWPKYFEDYDIKNTENRKVSVYSPIWSEDSKHAALEVRSLDNKDRWIMKLDAQTGELDLLDRQHDEAWIGGPGVSGWGRSKINWMPDNKNIWFQSEESGYSHIYKVNVDTKQKIAITKGEFEIYDPVISKDKKSWYYTSNEEHPGERYFYKMPINGGEKTKLTNLKGNNEVSLSPDEKWIAYRNSYSNKPWEIYLQQNKPNAKAKKVTSSLTNEFKSYSWREPEVISYKAQDGTDVYARLYRPEGSVNNGAAVIFVHGAGYLQNAHNWWSSYFREYMFHNLLADKGYTILDIDYRGSAGYGRDFRTGIYRHMGGKDLSDHVDGAKWLVDNEGVDQQRIGIYGGSYGGFITLMAMFTEPDVFAAGAALRSVTDWAHYNHYYTSNILNTPLTDSIAYRRSSPIYFAEGLEGSLLMCHGMVDGNVQFQDIVRLSQRLIELGKDDWELAAYPVEPHSFTEPSSWTDEYKRILKLFEENLKKE